MGEVRRTSCCLRALFDHGYLDRPGSQLAQAMIIGPQPMVYAITRKGARAIREYGSVDPDLNWADKNRKAGSVFIGHTVAIADFMTKLEVACRAREDVDLLEESEIIAKCASEDARCALSATMAREDLRGRGVQDGISDP
jgi:hypothetical protein